MAIKKKNDFQAPSPYSSRGITGDLFLLPQCSFILKAKSCGALPKVSSMIRVTQQKQ